MTSDALELNIGDLDDFNDYLATSYCDTFSSRHF